MLFNQLSSVPSFPLHLRCVSSLSCLSGSLAGPSAAGAAAAWLPGGPRTTPRRCTRSCGARPCLPCARLRVARPLLSFSSRFSRAPPASAPFARWLALQAARGPGLRPDRLSSSFRVQRCHARPLSPPPARFRSLKLAGPEGQNHSGGWWPAVPRGRRPPRREALWALGRNSNLPPESRPAHPK